MSRILFMPLSYGLASFFIKVSHLIKPFVYIGFSILYLGKTKSIGYSRFLFLKIFCFFSRPETFIKQSVHLKMGKFSWILFLTSSFPPADAFKSADTLTFRIDNFLEFSKSLPVEASKRHCEVKVRVRGLTFGLAVYPVRCMAREDPTKMRMGIKVKCENASGCDVNGRIAKM